MTRTEVYDLIDLERARQKAKWGHCDNRVENPITGPEWKIGVLGEEFGEVCKAVVEEKPDELRKELTHLAAVCVAWLESLPL